MASFEERSLLDPIRVFRPKAHDAKAWWRYAILAERYKVRCAQREELWFKAGASNMNILAHIRSLIKKHGSFDGVNLDDANGDFVEEEDSTKKLHPLELVVDDLNRENMALRKMIKTLLTPLARESFVAEEMSIEDLDKQISVFEEFAAKTSVAASPSPRSQHNSPLRLGGQMEDEADDQLVASLANCVDSPNINLHSPYENLLPPIALTDKDINGPKSARNSRASIRNSPQKPAQDKFPSYLEREAMRRETIAKKRQEAIMVSLKIPLAPVQNHKSNQFTPFMYITEKSGPAAACVHHRLFNDHQQQLPARDTVQNNGTVRPGSLRERRAAQRKSCRGFDA